MLDWYLQCLSWFSNCSRHLFNSANVLDLLIVSRKPFQLITHVYMYFLWKPPFFFFSIFPPLNHWAPELLKKRIIPFTLPIRISRYKVIDLSVVKVWKHGSSKMVIREVLIPFPSKLHINEFWSLYIYKKKTYRQGKQRTPLNISFSRLKFPYFSSSSFFYLISNPMVMVNDRAAQWLIFYVRASDLRALVGLLHFFSIGTLTSQLKPVIWAKGTDIKNNNLPHSR